MMVTRDEVPDLIKPNNDQLMASFKELLKDTAGQIKSANESSTEQQIKWKDQEIEMSRTPQV